MTKPFLIAALLFAPLAAQADSLKEDMSRKGIYYQSAGYNFDGSVTFVWPRLSYNGKNAYLYSSEANRKAFCNLLNKEFAEDAEYWDIDSDTALHLKITGNGKSQVSGSGSTYRSYLIHRITCSEKTSHAPVAANMEALLKRLREVNGVDVRSDGSVVIDTRIAKRVVIQGDGRMLVQGNQALSAQ